MAIGVATAIAPGAVVATGRRMVSPGGLYAAAAFRTGIGLVLLLAAKYARAPGLLRVLGLGAILVGAATPFLGVPRAMARLDWESSHITFLRIEGVVFVWLGFLIISLLKPPVLARQRDEFRG